MTQNTRVLIAVLVLVILVAAILGLDAWRRSRSSTPALAPGAIPIYLNGQFVGGFSPDDLSSLETVSFVDAKEGKRQEGWMLRDVLLLHLEQDELAAVATITVSSGSRDKAAQLTWDQVNKPANMVMFDLAGRGTLKLVSLLEELDVRDEWVQDVDKIELETAR